MRLDRPVAAVLDALAEASRRYDSRRLPDLGDALLVCATETKTEADIDAYVAALEEILAEGERLRA